MSTRTSSERLVATLKSWKVEQLKAEADARGLVIGAPGGGSPKKDDYIKSLAVHMMGHPSHVKVQAEAHYHNGGIPDGYGLEWTPEEERVVPAGIFQQMMDDNPRNWHVIERLTMLAEPEESEEEEDADED